MDIREACQNQKRIDTHGHIQESFWPLKGEAENWRKSISNSRVLAEGCRALHGIDAGAFLREDSPPAVFEASEKFRSAGEWQALELAFDKSGIEKQLIFCGFKPSKWRPFNEHLPGGRIAYLAYLEQGLNSHSAFPCPTPFAPVEGTYYSRLCDLFGNLGSLQNYLDELDKEIDTWRGQGVVGMKSCAAYTSGLAIFNPTLEAARAAFARKDDMTMQDFYTVHDFAYHHALTACLRNNLPIVIHTGVQFWGQSELQQANPSLLHNLLLDPRYKELTFVLLHGGNPFVGQTTYLAYTFPNVIVDFTWIGWLTPLRFKHALSEWLAMIPNDRFCWGSDSNVPESIVGIDRVMRRLIGETLEESIRDRLIDERYAFEFIENCFYSTPKRVFGL